MCGFVMYFESSGYLGDIVTCCNMFMFVGFRHFMYNNEYKLKYSIGMICERTLIWTTYVLRS